MPPNATNQQVIDAFKQASNNLGMGNWGLLTKAGLNLGELARDQATRHSLYTGPSLEQLAQLSEEERYHIRLALPDDVSFATFEQEAFLGQRLTLVQAALALPEEMHMILPAEPTPAQRRVAAVWNRFGFLLIRLRDALGLDVQMATTVAAEARGRPGLDSAGRLVVRFQVDAFFGGGVRSMPPTLPAISALIRPSRRASTCGGCTQTRRGKRCIVRTTANGRP